MQAGNGFGATDGDDAVMAEIIAAEESIDAELRAAQVRQVRNLARAGQLADKEAAGEDERVKAHEMALRSIAAEIAGVDRVSDRTVQNRIGEAQEIVESYPASLAAWESGAITRGHVRVIVEHGRNLPDGIRPEYEAAAIEKCRTAVPRRVAPAVEMIAQRLHPQTMAERHEDAAAGRCVKVFPGRDGMSQLVADLPTALADGVYDRLTRMGRAIVDARAKGAANDDHRSMDAVRADVFSDLLLTGGPDVDPGRNDDGNGSLGAIRATVQVVVAMETLIGDDDGPADLVGRSPIDPNTARCLAGDARVWERLLVHPVTGTVLEVDTYRPTLEMRRLLRGRDQRCRFPGCRLAAKRCEIDHTVDHALGGRTCVCNLAHLCQRHHSMKQFTPWRVRQLEGGVLEWTSPLGRIYREDAPIPVVWFGPAPPEELAPF